MTTLVIGKSGFNGEIPRLPPDRLPDGYAQSARNCDLAHGDLRSLAGLGEVFPCAEEALPVRSVFTPDGRLFFAWPAYTRAFLWPTTDDLYRRIIYQSEGEGVRVTQTDYLVPLTGRPGPPAVAHVLGVPTPVIESALSSSIGFDAVTDAVFEAWWLVKTGGGIEVSSTKLTSAQIGTVARWGEYVLKLSAWSTSKLAFDLFGLAFTCTLNTNGLWDAPTVVPMDERYWGYPGGGLIVGVDGDNGRPWKYDNYLFIESIKITFSASTTVMTGTGFPMTSPTSLVGGWGGGHTGTAPLGGWYSRFKYSVGILGWMVTSGELLAQGTYSVVPVAPYSYSWTTGSTPDGYVGDRIWTTTHTSYIVRQRSVGNSGVVTNLGTFSTLAALVGWLDTLGRVATVPTAQWFRWRIYSPSQGILFASEDVRLQPSTGASVVTHAYTLKTGQPVGAVQATLAYTAVARNERGEESVPSDPVAVDIHAGESFALTARVDMSTQFVPVVTVDFFRTAGTTGEFYLLASVPVDADGVARYVDTGAELSSVRLQSVAWDMPPPDAANLTYVGNGFFAVSSGKELFFSEPYHPHAWPYRMLFPYEVVGIIAVEGGVLVTTTAQTWLVLGTYPDSMTQQMSPAEQQGWSSKSMTRVSGTAIYASNDGLVSVAGGQPSIVDSQRLFARADWAQAYGGYPLELSLACHDGMVLGITEPRGVPVDPIDDSGGTRVLQDNFLLRLDEAAGSFSHIDLGVPTYSATVVDAVDRVYIGTDTGVAEFAVGEALYKDWLSQTFVFPRPTMFATCEVDAEGDGEIEVRAGERTVVTRSVAGPVQFRLPAVPSDYRWSVRLSGTAVFKTVKLGASFAELQGV